MRYLQSVQKWKTLFRVYNGSRKRDCAFLTARTAHMTFSFSLAFLTLHISFQWTDLPKVAFLPCPYILSYSILAYPIYHIIPGIRVFKRSSLFHNFQNHKSYKHNQDFKKKVIKWSISRNLVWKKISLQKKKVIVYLFHLYHVRILIYQE